MNRSELRHEFVALLKSRDYPNHAHEFTFQLSLNCYEKGLISGDELTRNFEFNRYKREGVPGAEFRKKYWKEVSSIFWELIAHGTLACGSGPSVGDNPIQYFQITDQ